MAEGGIFGDDREAVESPLNSKDPLGLFELGLNLRNLPPISGNQWETAPVVPPPGQVEAKRGIKKGTVDHLRRFLQRIISNPYGGILLSSARLEPYIEEDGTSHYRHGTEYKTQFIMKKGKVDLCRDQRTGFMFVRKKYRNQQRLHGSEFLLEMIEQPLFPNIWGVSKDETAAYVYFEYCEGGSLSMARSWRPCNLRLLATSLLKGLCFMHSLPAIHYDLKPGNIALRRSNDPTSVVLIDLDSVKRPELTFHGHGYTPNFVSPWHNQLVEKATKKGFHNDLVLVDLWAVHCVIISLWCGRTVWLYEHLEISKGRHRDMTVCCGCQECIRDLCRVIGNKWKDIVPLHLLHQLKNSAGDEDARALLRLLQYIADSFIRVGRELQGQTVQPLIFQPSAEGALQALDGAAGVAAMQPSDN